MNFCYRTEVSLNGHDAPSPEKMVGVGNVVRRHKEKQNNSHIGTFEGFYPGRFRLVFRVSDFKGFATIGNSKDDMLKKHSLTIRYYAENSDTPIRTVTMGDVVFEFIGVETDRDGSQIEVVEGVPTTVIQD